MLHFSVALIGRARSRYFSLSSLSLLPFSPIGCRVRVWVKLKRVCCKRLLFCNRVEKWNLTYGMQHYSDVVFVQRWGIFTVPCFFFNVPYMFVHLHIQWEDWKDILSWDIDNKRKKETHLPNKGSSSSSLLDKLPSGQPTFRGQSHVCKSWLKRDK